MSLRLHEAIRLGAALKPQAFHVLLSPGKTHTCAYGAALDAVGMLSDDHIEGVHYANGGDAFCLKTSLVREATQTFPFLWWAANHGITCPHANCVEQVRTPIDIIVHLNDTHRWTRNAIADYIQPIEDAWWAQQEAQSKTTERKEEPICT